MTRVGDVIDIGSHSWQEALEPGELLGGPSPWGNSRYQVFKSCPYKYWWQFVKRMTRIDYDPNLEVGGLYHEARARYASTYLKNVDPEGKLLVSSKKLDELCILAGTGLIDRAEAIVPGTAALTRRLFRAWLTLYGPGTPADRRKTLYDTELVLQVEEPVPYSTRIDEWHWDPRYKGPRINEIKTAGRRDEKLLNSYRMDAQFLGHQYLWKRTMARRYGRLVGYDVDLVTKTDEVRCTLESVPIDWTLVKEFEVELRQLYADIMRCKAIGVWPKRMTYHCTRPWPCRLYDHCASNGRISVGWRKKLKGEY